MQRWGAWHYDAENLALVIDSDGGESCEVDLEALDTSAVMLDLIFKVSGQPWATSAIIGDLVCALDALLAPAENLCSAGEEQSLRGKSVQQILSAREY